jgi:hypothetical protein
MEGPTALAHLLAWSKNLENFEFQRIYSNRFHWDFATFETVLAPYRDTLKHITIGYLSGGTKTIDFSGFTELLTLNLSRWQLDCSPETASSTLLAPKLHTFTWDFGIYDQHSESVTDFAEPQADWILALANLAAARKASLKTIEIEFNPESSYSQTAEQHEALKRPWDLMNGLSIKMRPLGIELKYKPIPLQYEIEFTDQFYVSEEEV